MKKRVLIGLCLMAMVICASNVWAGNEGPPNVFYGNGAGASEVLGTADVFIGVNAGTSDNGGQDNTFVGDSAGFSQTTAYGNTFIGSDAGFFNSVGAYNTFLGRVAGFNNIDGEGNTFVGDSSGSSNLHGSDNTCVGLGACGWNQVGSSNVCLGLAAGFNELGSHRLYIDNNYSLTPFIYGEFDNRILKLDGSFGVNVATSPEWQIEVDNDGGLNASIGMRVASSTTGVPAFFGKRAGGSLASPSATPLGKGLFWLGGGGYGTTGWMANLGGTIGFYASENWTDTANGTDIRFSTTTNGTTTRTEKMRITDSGDVGIGTTTPMGTLDVNGPIYQRGLQIHADYVFEPAYKMESIEEHAKYMWENKHLKAVPGARKDENGLEIVEIGQHQRGILEELEKAHVYIERLNKANKELYEANHDLNQKMHALEARLRAVETSR